MSVLAPQRAGNKVIQAEGEAQAVEKPAQAENIIGVYPPSIPLQPLQTLTEISAENNSTLILPLPIDLTTAFFQTLSITRGT
jgi:hypothetical protein